MASVLDLAALYAAGALAPKDRENFRARLASASAGDRRECAAIQDAAAVLSVPATELEPSAAVRSRLLARIAGETSADTPAGFQFVAAGDAWHPLPALPGISLKQLAVDDRSGTVTLLARLAAGTRFPEHDHYGPEQTYIVSGDLHSGGRRLGAGDFFFAAAGSHHDGLYTETGCTALLILSAGDAARLL